MSFSRVASFIARIGLLVASAAGILLPARDAYAHTAFAKLYDHWRYDASGTDLGTSWRAPAFDDTAWALGETPIGQGGGVNYQTQIPISQQTTYLRRSFELDVDPASVTSVRLKVVWAHGFVLYLNGQELERRNLPGGSISFSTPATENVLDPADPFVTIDLASAPAALVAGTNVLALELHQTSPASSFLLWAPEITFQTSGEHVTRAPYLQIATPTEVTVRWRTSIPTDSVVSYGDAPGSLDLSAADATETTEHEVVLTGLSPATEYFYAIGSSATPELEGGDEAHAFTTPPEVGTPGDARIWVLGDAGTRHSGQRAVRDGYASFNGTRRTDLWLMLGDNAYGEGLDDQYQYAVFEDMYEPTLRSAPLWPAMGNHDWQDGSNVAYLDIFSLPTEGQAGGAPSQSERWYAFDYANVHFVCLDTTTLDLAVSPESERTAMLDWLEDDLAGATAPWLVAFFHHPPYSKGSHDSDTDGLLDEVRDFILPPLEDAGVDLVLTGHSHVYERSILLDGHYGPSPEFADDPGAFTIQGGDGREDGDGVYVKPAARGPHQGAVYVVSGNSGGRGDEGEWTLDHPVMVELYDPHDDRIARGLMASGSFVLDLDGNRLDGSYVDFEGQVLDTFAIVKGEGGTGEGGAGGGDAGGNGAGAGGATDGGGGGGIAADGDLDDGCGCKVAHDPPGDTPWSIVAMAGIAAALASRRRRRAF